MKNALPPIASPMHLSASPRRPSWLSVCATLALFFAIGCLNARAATWYLQADQSVDWNTLSIWWSQPLNGGTHPVAISPADDFDLSGHQVLTPKVSGTVTFGGNSLILHGGNGGYINGKTDPAVANIVIPKLVSYGGNMTMRAYTGNLPVSITTFINHASTTLSGGSSTRGLDFTITTLSGEGDINALGGVGTSAGGAVLMDVAAATGFTGTLYIADGCQFTFKNAFTSGGALDVHFSPGTTVTTDHMLTFKGLTINGVAKAVGTYSAASLGFAGTGGVVVQAAATPPAAPLASMIGVNLPGGSISSYPFYPTDAQVWDYLQTKQANLVRVGFRWERVQPALYGTLDAGAMASLDAVVALAAARGQQVLLDMHNYLYYSGTLVGSAGVPHAAYQDVWQKLAAHYAANTTIYGYDIMNEPGGTIANWNAAAQAAINGIRTSDTEHRIIVEGLNWANSQNWMSTNALLDVTDPEDKIVYSAHTYWSNSGNDTYGSYDSEHGYANMGVDRVAEFVYWLQLKGATGLIGEFGVPNNVASPAYGWNVALDKFLSYLNANGVHGTYWSMTQNGWPDSYALLCATGGKVPGPVVDAPAMTVLQNYFGGGAGLPSPWASGDLGAVSPAGSATYSGGTFTINTGSGLDLMVGYATDAFTHAYRPASGDCSVTARVATLSCDDLIKAEGGVMIRESLAADSPFALMGVTTGRGLQFTRRATAGAASVSVAGPSGVAPKWVRVTRVGDTFTAYWSADNITWTQVGTPQTIPMATDVYIGLPVCNHGGTGTATFDTVTASP